MTFANYFGESEEVEFDDCFSRSFKGFGQAGEERRVGEGRGETCGETQNFEQSINQTVVSQVRLGQGDLRGEHGRTDRGYPQMIPQMPGQSI